MPLATLSDVNLAFTQGRWHTQRFMKNVGPTHNTQWADATFSSGQPAYDAHVGTPNKFTPCIAGGNDAIYLPPVAAGQHRHLVSMTMRSAQNGGYTGPESLVVFDLLGFYPLIDGDSTDPQLMDNSLALPRYANGDGVIAVLVNHVAPAVQTGEALVTVTDASGIQRNVAIGFPANGVNLVCSNYRGGAGTGGDVGALAMSLDSPRGIRSIDAIQYTTPPGGLHAIYLLRPLSSMVLGDNLVASEKNLVSHNAFHAPRVFDGAWLGWFSRITPGTARGIAWFGDFTFAWG